MTFSFQRTRGRTMAPSRTTSSESRPPTQHTFPAFNATGSREYFPETVHVCTKLDMVTKLQGTRFVQLQTIPFTDLPNRRERQGRSGGRIGLRKFYFINCACPKFPLLEFRFVVISKITDQKFRNSWRKQIFISFSRRQIPISELERTLSPFYNLLRLTQNFLPFRFPRQRFRFTIYILYLKIIPSPPRNTQKFDREKKVSIHTSAIIENEGGSMEGLRDLPSIPVLWGGRFTSYAGSRGGSFLELSRPSPILTGMISVFERSWNLYLSAEHHPEIVLVLLSRVGRNRGERAMEIFPWPLASTDVQHS